MASPNSTTLTTNLLLMSHSHTKTHDTQTVKKPHTWRSTVPCWLWKPDSSKDAPKPSSVICCMIHSDEITPDRYSMSAFCAINDTRARFTPSQPKHRHTHTHISKPISLNLPLTTNSSQSSASDPTTTMSTILWQL